MRSKRILRMMAICLKVLATIVAMAVGISAHTSQCEPNIGLSDTQFLVTAVPASQAVMLSTFYRNTSLLLPVVKTVDIAEKKLNGTKLTYAEEDLDLLSRLIYAEAGCDWIPDDIQLYVGSVVLNRVENDLFPDNIHDVIYAKGQYSPIWSGTINNSPDERTIANAKRLLEDGSLLPANVVFQANFKQGDGVYYEYYDKLLGSTTFFCFIELN